MSATDGLEPYAPLGVLKPLGRDIWLVDGPVVRMRYVAGTLPFTTRMTVARLPDGGLWLHSPVALTSGLLAEIRALGRVAALVAPNGLHWEALADWQAVFPDVETWGAPGLAEKAAARGYRIDHELGDTAPLAWGDAIAQVLVAGGLMTEAVFLHRKSSTLIVTDLIENFERGRVRGGILRFVMRFGGVVDPRGSTPRDLRLTYVGRRRQVRAAVETMLRWRPERVVLSHGRPYLRDGTAELRRAMAWTGARG